VFSRWFSREIPLERFCGKTSEAEGRMLRRSPVFPNLPAPKTGCGNKRVGVELIILSENTIKIPLLQFVYKLTLSTRHSKIRVA
jgi:hypothetical protein